MILLDAPYRYLEQGLREMDVECRADEGSLLILLKFWMESVGQARQALVAWSGGCRYLLPTRSKPEMMCCVVRFGL